MMTKLSNNEIRHIMHVHTFNISGVNNNSFVCGRWNDAALALSLMPNKFFNLLLKFSSFAISLSSIFAPLFYLEFVQYLSYQEHRSRCKFRWRMRDLHVHAQFYLCMINAFHLKIISWWNKYQVIPWFNRKVYFSNKTWTCLRCCVSHS